MKPYEERGYRLGKLAQRAGNPRSTKEQRESSLIQMVEILADYFPQVVSKAYRYIQEEQDT